MKKIMILLLFGLFLSSLLYITSGCKKDPIVPLVAGNTMVTFIPLGEITFTGDPILIKWKVVGDYSSFTVTKNGIVIPTSPCDSIWIYDVSEKLEFLATCTLAPGNDPIVRSLTIFPKGSTLPPTLTVTSRTLTPYDENDTIRYQATHTDSVLMDGVHLPSLSGYKVINHVRENALYHLIAYGPGGTAFQDVSTTVGSPPTPHPLQDTIILHPWSEFSSLTSCSGDENGQWFPGNIQQSDKDVRYVFYSDGHWKAFRYGLEINHGDYLISETDSTMNWGGGIYQIKILTSTTMLLKLLTLAIGCPGNQGWIKITYKPSVVKK